MKMQIQPDRASCLVFAAAMAIDIKADELLSGIGHDGTEIIWPDCPIPFCFRGFHILEITRELWKRGWSVTQFDNEWWMGNDTDHVIRADRHFNLLRWVEGCKHNAILLNSHHAVAWDSKSHRIFDPNGEIYPWLGEVFDSAFIVARILDQDHVEGRQ